MGASPSAPRYHALRRSVQVGLLLFYTLCPWLGLMRVDIDARTVTYFGTAYPLDWPYTLGLMILFVVIVWSLAILSYLKGRVFCGWGCPYSSAVELFDGLRTVFGNGKNRAVAAWMRRSVFHRWGLRVGAALTLVAAPTILALSLAAYFWDPGKVLGLVFRTPWGAGGPVQTLLLAFIVFTALLGWLAGYFVRFHFCRLVCIYGMGQAMAASSGDPKTILRPRYLPASLDACGSCQACLKACHLELDPREKHLVFGVADGCFNCGECVEVCGTVQSHKGNAPLLDFSSGSRR
ncbi:MAG: 4Fe-4S binding protein [Acidobacteria bacterium]|nr:4Fe-4S binding protein [Acidobacteriota bacterium]